MKISLNDEVKVKLTSEGVKVLANRHYKLRKKIISNRGEDIGPYTLRLDEDGYYTTQLWILLNVFQAYFNWISADVFQKNEFIFKDSEEVE